MIHAVTDGTGLPRSVQQKIIHSFSDVDFICIREKQLSLHQLSQKINELLQSGLPAEKVIVHSVLELADRFPVQGVHFTEHDERLAHFKREHPSKLAGRSVHSVEAAERAEADGADYLYFGHVFNTNSKKGLPGRGLHSLSHVTEAVTIPVIAIGGIHSGNIEAVRQAGASGAAMISAFFK